LGLVGESGSGKSTLANAAMGLLPPGTKVTGLITVAGEDVTTMSPEALRRMRGNVASMIFQDASASLDPVWPVGDQIAETIRAHHDTSRRDAKARAIALMEEVGIPDAARRYSEAPHRFSGGMRQRIVIAAALANEPQLLIADEPTTALDVTIQAQVLELLDQLRRNHGTTVLLITHDLGVVAQVCDRVGVMCKGRLLETAPTDRLFTDPDHPYTRALLAANPASAQRGERLPVIPTEWSVESLEAGARDREASHG
ncbi:MAG: ABC transporter ATP-binding protein, partial [Alphaproteobacteria bacterium]|nr:ABC transporter ATP-binding protein [Alphaproteobacteria bacterium]